MNALRNSIFVSLFLLTASFALPISVEAAVLRMRPPQSEVTVGNIVNLQVTVDTAGKIINNAESVIQFPTDLLEVVSIDKSSSIFSLWVENPSFSNAAGQATFNGGVPNPGYQGSSGNVVSIVFRAKKAGVASVVFLNSAVRENDGLGTDILSGKAGSEITIRATQAPPPVVESGFVVTSPTHPNQNGWYNKDDIAISWTLPKGATAVRTLLGAYPTSEPTIYYSTPITSKDIENLEDGIWYFHAQHLTGGVWSKALHYKLQIDTASPTDLSARSEKDDTGKVTLYLKAGDSLSGVDRFTVTINDDKPIVAKSDGSGEASVEVPFSRPGEHTLTIAAYDKAGNKTETKTTVVADSVSELRITSYPATIKVNESIEISGGAPYPYAPLRISLKDGEGVVQVYKLKSNSYSEFNFISQPITVEGNYTLWVDMLGDEEEVTLSSQEIMVSAETPLLLQIGSYTIGLMKVLIPAVVLLMLFLAITLYGWLKLFGLYRRVKKEGREAEQVSSKTFRVLRSGVDRHVTQLKKVKRALTEEELEFLQEFSEKLEEAEEAVGKEIRDITRL